MKTISKIKFASILLAALVLSACNINKMTEKQFKRVAVNEPFDVVIVPGAPIGDSSLNNVLISRILWSKYLLENNITKNVIYSGGAVHTAYIEGLAMKMYADSIGIPSNRTFAETKAEHSTENVYYSYKLAKEKGFEKIALATDLFQTMMVSSYVKKNYKDVKFLPIVYNRIFASKKIYDQLPIINVGEAHISEENFVPLNQRESFFKRLAGTFGKNIAKQETFNVMDQSLQAYNDSIVSIYLDRK
jgi:uncharacterized SAM-binding protein YcdF (DUF218 family)